MRADPRWHDKDMDDLAWRLAEMFTTTPPVHAREVQQLSLALQAAVHKWEADLMLARVGRTVPTPAAAVETTLTTERGYYVTAESGGGGELVANRAVSSDGPGPWESFLVEVIDGTHVALQAHNGMYVAAELDGGVSVDRAGVGPWETWEWRPYAHGVVFVSHHGKYLCAEDGGGGLVVANRPLPGQDPATVPGAWEVFMPSANWWDTNPNALAGPLERDGRVIWDTSGPRVVMCCHFMEAFSAWCHGWHVEVEAECREIAKHYAAIRVLDVLGYHDCNREGEDYWVAWKGREVTPIEFMSYSGRMIPATPHYWEQKRAFVTMLHDVGLKIMDDRGDMNAWTDQDKRDHMYDNGEFYQSLPFGREVLLGVWACNEAWQNGGDDRNLLVELLNEFEIGAGWMPAVCGLSAPGGSSDPEALAACDPPMSTWEPEMPDSFKYWSAPPASVLTVHGNRGSHEHIIEHYFNYGYDEVMRDTGQAPFNTEPVGGGEGVSVGRVDDPELLCAISAAAMLGGQCWTFMSGNGVFWNGPIPSMPGFLEVPALTKWIPQDVASWPTVVHSGERWKGTRILAAVDPTRFDQAISADGRFVAMCHTAEGGGQWLPCERACAEFTVVHPSTGWVERAGPLQVGEMFRHNGLARLIVGRLA